jgi:hypothetical protein
MSFITALTINSPYNWAYKGPTEDDTELYKEYTLIFTESLYLFHPQETLHFLAVNFTPEFKRQLLDVHPRIKFAEEYEDFEGTSQQYYKEAIVLRKVLWILEVLKESETPQIWFDCDILIRNELTQLQNLLNEDCKITCLYRPERVEEDMKYNVGVIGFKPSGDAFKFLNAWYTKLYNNKNKFMTKRRTGRLFSGEQLYFKRCVEETKVKVAPLPETYNDGLLAKESIVWHGHKINKWKSSHIFKSELERLKNKRRKI